MPKIMVVFQLPAELKRQGTREITKWLGAGKLTNDIGPRFSLAETPQTHQAVEGGAIGKVLVVNR